jgi:hypothetical protein
MDSFLQDVRIAVRGYLATPLFTIVVLSILGLAIGANSAIFSVVNAVLLRPLDYPHAAALVSVSPRDRVTQRRRAMSPPNYFDVKDQARAFAGIAAYWSPSVNLSGDGGDPEKVQAATCSHDLFAVLGVNAMAGRALTADDDVPGARAVAVLGHGLWQRRFGSDPRVIGRETMLDGAPTLIVGVMPPAFDFPVAGTELWVPLRLSRTQPPNRAIPADKYRQYRILSVVARLKPGVAIEQARVEMSAIAGQLESAYPEANRNGDIGLVPLQDIVVAASRPALLILLAAVGCVLLIACANVGSLLLVRAAGRSREITIRMALGADRGRLVRQMLTESVVLAGAGGGAGLVVSAWALDLLLRFAPAGIPRLDRVRMDGAAVAFTFLIAISTGLLFGLVPAFQIRATRLQDALLASGRGLVSGAHQRLRQALTVAEIALSLMLLVGAVLLIQSFARVQRVDTGFRAASVLTVQRIELPRSRASAEASAAFFDGLVVRLRAIPGVESAAVTLGRRRAGAAGAAPRRADSCRQPRLLRDDRRPAPPRARLQRARPRVSARRRDRQRDDGEALLAWPEPDRAAHHARSLDRRRTADHARDCRRGGRHQALRSGAAGRAAVVRAARADAVAVHGSGDPYAARRGTLERRVAAGGVERGRHDSRAAASPDGRGVRRRRRAAALPRLAARTVCSDGDPAGDDRSVRHDGVCHSAAHARDRAAHRPRGDAAPGDGAAAPPRSDPHGARHADRPRRIGGRGAGAVLAAVRRRRGGSGDVHRRAGGACRRGRARLLSAGPAGAASRRDQGDQCGVTAFVKL